MKKKKKLICLIVSFLLAFSPEAACLFGQDASYAYAAEPENVFRVTNPPETFNLDLTGIDGGKISTRAHGRPLVLILGSLTCWNCQNINEQLRNAKLDPEAADYIFADFKPDTAEDLGAFRDQYGSPQVNYCFVPSGRSWQFARNCDPNIEWSVSPLIIYKNSEDEIVGYSEGYADILSNVESLFGVKPVKSTKVKLSETELTIFTGDTVKLSMENTSKKVKWSSSKPSVAKVSSSGKVTALKTGNAVITASVGKKKYTCSVKVKAPFYKTANSTGIKKRVEAPAEYRNWEGVSNVCQFQDQKGRYCFASQGTTYVTVYVTEDSKVVEKIRLKKQHEHLGTVACDAEGNFYVVSGEENPTDTIKDTVFVTKYSHDGKLIATVGDNGSSSLAPYYDPGFYTARPFEGGNCDIAINGKFLAVNYAREMYSGHQSNSLLFIHTDRMTKLLAPEYYNSHSFAQRIVPYKNGFLLASEGDVYDRAFTVSVMELTGGLRDYNIFDFWLEEGAFTDYDMYRVNENFAHMGDIAVSDEKHAALLGTSAESLSAEALNETERLFIQIFDPGRDLGRAEAYYTMGERSGIGGPDGKDAVTDHGVQWLTSGSYIAEHPQMVTDSQGRFIILFEKYTKKNYKYKGVYSMIVGKEGEVIQEPKLFSSLARLNPCETPVVVNDTVYWTGNKYGASSNYMYVYDLQIPIEAPAK